MAEIVTEAGLNYVYNGWRVSYAGILAAVVGDQRPSPANAPAANAAY